MNRIDQNDKYQIVTIPPGAMEKRNWIGTEPMGSKKKFWTWVDSLSNHPWLFKYPRIDTGEHWAEKIASEIAKLISLPSIRAEFAKYEGETGIIVESLIPHETREGEERPLRMGTLIHGNEILAARITGYEKTKQRMQVDHSWNNICDAVRAIFRNNPDYDAIMSQFGGLLVLDALIVNTDRHHENWALLLLQNDNSLALAPSYDHASSLGRELNDQKRKSYIENKSILNYVKRAHGAIYGKAKTDHPDNPLDLVKWAMKNNPAWFRPWLERVESIPMPEYVSIIERVPGTIMTETAKLTVIEILSCTSRILKEFLT